MKSWGEETSVFRFTGKTTLDVAGHSIDYSVEQVECWTKLDIADALSAKGFALPRAAYELLSEEEQAKIEAGRPSVSTLFDRMKTDELGVSEQILANYDNIPEKLITVDDGPASVTRFSHLIPLYLESRKDDGKELGQRKLACEKVIEVCGDLPIGDYERLHAYDIAKAMSKDYGNATIKRYITYANGLFRWAVQNRDELGRAYLADLPWRDLELDSYGRAKQTYKPLETETVCIVPTRHGATGEATHTDSDNHRHEARRSCSAYLGTDSTRHGVSCFGLVGDARVKNEGSMRYVPVPSVVKPLLEMVVRVGFDYRIDKYGKAQAKASDAVMSLIRQVTQDPMKVATHQRKLQGLPTKTGVGKEINDFITGHGQGDVAGEYGEGPSMKKRLEVIDAVKQQLLVSSTKTMDHREHQTIFLDNKTAHTAMINFTRSSNGERNEPF